MSGSSGLCEKPIKSWEQYTKDEINVYVMRNMNRTDCSFNITGEDVQKSTKVEKSFKWILRDISPVLRELLEKEEKRGNDCKNIEIQDPNFEAVLYFAHTKSISKDRYYLPGSYRMAKKFKIEAMRNEVTKKIATNTSGVNFVDFFEIAYDEITDKRCSTKFEEVLSCFPFRESDVQSRFETVTNFDLEKFTEFFNKIYNRIEPYLCFQLVEAFLLKSVIKEPINKPEQELSNIEKCAVDFFMERINFGNMTFEDFKDGPQKSMLLDMQFKNRLEAYIRKGDKTISFSFN